MFQILRCPQLILRLAADKWLLFHPWAYVALLKPVSFPIYLGQSLLHRRHHANGHASSAGPPHCSTKFTKPRNSWWNGAAGLSRGNRKARPCLLHEMSTRKSNFSSFWWAREGEKHTLDFNYKQHTWISKLSEKHQNHINLFANNWNLRAKDS